MARFDEGPPPDDPARRPGAGPGPASRLTKAQFERLAEFRYQLRRFLRFSEEATLASGFTPLQYQLLLHVKGFPGRAYATISELAERLQARHNSVVALVSRCEELGLVQRRPGRRDLRLVEVHLTPRGEAVLQQLAMLHTHELAGHAGVLGPRSFATLPGSPR